MHAFHGLYRPEPKSARDPPRRSSCAGLCRQLRLSYSANRRSVHAFRVCLAGPGLCRAKKLTATEPPGPAAAPPEPAEHVSCSVPAAGPPQAAAANAANAAVGLRSAAAAEGWNQWDVKLTDTSTPGDLCDAVHGCCDSDSGSGGGGVVYLAAASPHVLEAIEPRCTYIIGGLVDHVAQPGAPARMCVRFGRRAGRVLNFI